MLVASYDLGAESTEAKTPTNEEQAKKIFEEAIASDDPVAYAAAAGAAIACGSIGGPYAAGLCALGAKALWEKLFGPSCKDQGGIRWCLSECDRVRVVGVGQSALLKCDSSRRIDPIPLSEYGQTVCGQPKHKMVPGSDRACCASTYCQLPDMPEPLPMATSGRLLDRWAKGGAATMTVATTQYPHGSITARDKHGMWHVAAPAVPELRAAEAAYYKEVALTPTKPAGLVELPFVDYLRRTDNLPWYKDWRVWAVAGGLVAAGGGLLAWKRRKRRKRR